MLKPGEKSRIYSKNKTIRNNAGFKRNIVQGYPQVNGQWLVAENSSTGAPSLYSTGDVEYGNGIMSPIIRGDPPLPPTLNNVNPFDSISVNIKKPIRQKTISGNAPLTQMERLAYNASTSRIDKIPRHHSFGGYGTRKSRRRKTTHRKRKSIQRKTYKRKSRRRRRTKHNNSNKKNRRRKGGTGENDAANKLSLGTKNNDLYVPKDSDGEYMVEDNTALPGTMGNVAKIRSKGSPPVYNPKTGRFE